MANGEQTDLYRRALAALRETRGRLAALEAREALRNEPIAVIGMACRFPGGVVDPESYWRLLEAGTDAISDVPADRWDAAALFDPDPEAAGKAYCRQGGFVPDVDLFDADFFGIAPREAASIDPQQRLLLEVAWEALERAGVPAPALAGTRTGVYVGICADDYFRMGASQHLAIDAWLSSGSVHSVAAGRIAFTLGLVGPAMAVDTACSSSLVAVHLACQALRQGECEVALAGGVNLMLTPELTINFSRARMLSPTGRCHTFDASADGYVRGEGAGVVVLKPLSRARADGDEVLAVIRGSAVNQDGRTSGLTVPSGPSQAVLLREALGRAGVAADAVGYVEAHGTGTRLGDPIEAGALGDVFGGRERPLLVGSVKANIGHLESAAGMAGLLKVILSLRHGVVPGQLHFATPNPHIDWAHLPLRVPVEAVAWPAGERIGGVSSFGFSGTNAHVVVAEAPKEAALPAAEGALSPGADGVAPSPIQAAWASSGTGGVVTDPGSGVTAGPGSGVIAGPGGGAAAAAASGMTSDPGSGLLVVSGRGAGALRAQADRWAAWLRAHPDASVADVCRTAALGRAAFADRLAVVGSDAAELAAGLERFAATGEGLSGRTTTTPPKIGFLFSGQGTQWSGMGRALYDTAPCFRAVLDRCAAAVMEELDRPLLDVMFSGGAALDQTAYTQPALYALSCGLDALWRRWGIEPAAVLGHSVGAYAAAQAAGVFSLESGARLVARRGRLMQALGGDGVMVAVAADEARVRAALAGHEDAASLAAVNGPQACVVSGERAAVAAVCAALSGVRQQKLAVSHAFHAPQMAPMLGAFAQAVAGEAPSAPQGTLLVSDSTGAVAGAEVQDPAYWVRHVREPVRFGAGVETLAGLGCDVLVEIGPKRSLLGLAAQAGYAGTLVASLRAGEGGWQTLLAGLGALWVRGVAVAWPAVCGPGRKAVLPGYPFQRKRHWLSQRPVAGATSASIPKAAASDATSSDVASGMAAASAGITSAGAAPDGAVPASLSLAVAWVPAPAVKDVADASGRWLVLGSAGGLGQRLAAELERRGGVVRHLAEGADGPTGPDWRGLVDLRGLDAPDGEESFAAMAAAQRGRCLGALQLLRGLRGGAGRLWVAERDGRPSAVPGLLRAAALEQPGSCGGVLRLRGEVTAAAVADAVLGLSGEAEIRLSGEGREVARLERRSASVGHAELSAGRPWLSADGLPAGQARLSADGIYLVTGGYGGLGLQVAAWLREQGARQIALVGRRGPGPAAEQAIARLRGAGADVLCETADVGDAAAVADLLGRLGRGGRPLRGVVHAAGVMSLRGLDDLDAAELDRVLAPKLGLWTLDRLTREQPVELFVAFSSIAAVWGSKGQAAYAAANGFMDGVIAERRALGLTGLSVNWGPWAGAGMLDAAGAAWLRGAGVRPLHPAVALAELDRLVASGAESAVVADVDWSLLAALHASLGTGGLFDQLVAEAPAPHGDAASAMAAQGIGAPNMVSPDMPAHGIGAQDIGVEDGAAAPLRRRVLTAAKAQQRTMLTEEVVRLVKQALGHADDEALDLRLGFFDLGMDSLMAVELRGRLQRLLGVELPATMAFTYPTVAALVDHLAGLLGLDAPHVPAVTRTAATVTANEPIAVIGMGCRFPGGAVDPESYWRLLATGLDAIVEVPADRWDKAALYDPAPDAAGKTYSLHGGFIPDIDLFDADFFAIPPREAASVDPQQRLLLEVAWEALERAAIPPPTLAGTRTGVYVGVTANDYGRLLLDAAHMGEPLDPYYVTGATLNAVAGRLAFCLGLQGPAMAVDTACSSSLVAVHLACQALRQGECEVALAGGVNVILSPDHTIAVSRARMLSPSGHCHVFDAGADGFVRGEGAGVVVLKPLSRARADGDEVLAVIRGSAVNQDGRTSGLTVPSGPSQAVLLREALGRAGVAADAVGYVEAHGTGTRLGDPIEAGALGDVFGGRERPLLVGSVKANIGHLESAAGMAGLLKVILSLRHGVVPGQLHFATPNPHIDWAHLPLRVPAEAVPWPAGERIGGVSSFGFSGTNAHVVVAEAPAEGALVPVDSVALLPAGDGVAPSPIQAAWASSGAGGVVTDPGRGVIADSGSGVTAGPGGGAAAAAAASGMTSDPGSGVLVVSGRGAGALRAQADRWAAWLRSHPDASVADVCRTAALGRAAFADRLAVVGSDTAELAAGLERFAATGDGLSGRTTTTPPKIGFLFSGQGTQWSGMGRALYDTAPCFRAVMDRCAAAVAEELDLPLLDVMFSGGAALDQTAYTQPALYALSCGVDALWRRWGIEPAAVLGHSVGAYAAAQAAGVFSLESGARLVARRARLMQAQGGDGVMVAVAADEARVRAALAGHEDAASLAAVNGPQACVVSGERAAVAGVCAALSGVRQQPLAVSHAFHAPQMAPMQGAFAQAVAGEALSAPQGPVLVSDTTGAVAGAEMQDPAYWVRHVREPVRFGAGVETLAGLGCDVLVEIGPKRSLLGLAAQAGYAGTLVASLRAGEGGWQTLLAGLGALWVRGAAVAWPAVCGTGRKAVLPGYPFQRKRHWLSQRPVAAASGVALRVTGTPDGVVLTTAATSVAPPLASASGGAVDAAAAFGAAVPAAAVSGAAASAMAAGSVGITSAGAAPDGAVPTSLSLAVAWVPAPAAKNVADASGRWLVLGSAGGLGQRLAAELERRGGVVRHVVADAGGPAGPDWRGVVDLRGLDAPEGGESFAAMAAAQRGRCLAALQLLRGLRDGSGRLWVAERDGRPSAVPGLLRAAALEQPGSCGGVLRLRGEVTAASVADAVLGLSGEAEIRLSGEGREVVRPERRSASVWYAGLPAGRAPLSADGVYLVTGGYGGLGLQVAAWLRERGARQIALVGRRGPGPAAEQAIARLRGAGADVLCETADVGDAAAVADLLGRLARGGRPLRGVVHAAGVMSLRGLDDLDAAELDRVLAPKLGLWTLDRLTRGQPVELFVAFSSIAAVWGSKGQAAYAAANGFMDGVIAERRALGLTGLSVNWGPWAGAGMLDAAGAAWLRGAGVRPLDPAAALAELDRLVASGAERAVVADVDWPRLAALHASLGTGGLFDQLLAEALAPGDAAAASDSGTQVVGIGQLVGVGDDAAAPLRASLDRMPAQARRAALIEAIEQEVARVLRLDANPFAAGTMGFFEAGVDSFTAIELCQSFLRSLGCRLPNTLLLEHPTPERLADHLLSVLYRTEEPALYRTEQPALYHAEEPVDATPLPGNDAAAAFIEAEYQALFGEAAQ